MVVVSIIDISIAVHTVSASAHVAGGLSRRPLSSVGGLVLFFDFSVRELLLS